MFSMPSLILILVIVILLFGTKRLKNLGGDLGGALKGFKSALKDGDKTKSDSDDKESKIIEGEVIKSDVVKGEVIKESSENTKTSDQEKTQ